MKNLVVVAQDRPGIDKRQFIILATVHSKFKGVPPQSPRHICDAPVYRNAVSGQPNVET
mgnify:CR=1 FL=1